MFFFFSSRRRHTRYWRDWSSDVCSSDLGLFIANGNAIREPRLWDFASRRGKRSIILSVPGTYPPRPLNGVMVSCFLTPSTRHQYTYPPMLRKEVEQVVGEYLFDCTNRSE